MISGHGGIMLLEVDCMLQMCLISVFSEQAFPGRRLILSLLVLVVFFTSAKNLNTFTTLASEANSLTYLFFKQHQNPVM